MAAIPLLVMHHYVDVNPSLSRSQLCIAALLCGAALSVGAEPGLRSVFGIHAGCIAATLFSTLGLSLIWFECPVDFWPLPCLLIGLAVGSDWSSLAEVARRSLPTTVRWQGLRIWSVAFPAGSAVGFLLVVNAAYAGALPWLAVVMSTVVFALLLFGKRLAAIRPLPDAPAGVAANPSEPEKTEASKNSAEECDATECCGGGIREVQPASFRQGVLLAMVGVLIYYSAPWFVLASGFRSQPTGVFDAYSCVAFALGLPAGSWLIISAAPRIGYVVAVLPFLLLSAVFTLIWGFVALSGFALVVVAFCCGLFPTASMTGISAIVGELFSDCPTDAKRSRVISVALFAASAVMAVFSLLQTSSLPYAVRAAYLPAICIIGLLTIRNLPSPVISSLGKDDDGNSEDEELKDVIAQISKP